MTSIVPYDTDVAKTFLVQCMNMFDFYQQRKIRTVINSPYTQGLIVFMALGAAWSAYVRYDIAMEMAERREAASQQAAALMERKDELEKQVRYLESERGVEAEMRRQYDIALPGEQVVVILDEEDPESQVMPLSTTTSTSSQQKPWYQFW